MNGLDQEHRQWTLDSVPDSAKPIIESVLKHLDDRNLEALEECTPLLLGMLAGAAMRSDGLERALEAERETNKALNAFIAEKQRTARW